MLLGAAVALDAALWHFPAYVAGAALAAMLYVLAMRYVDWARTRPTAATRTLTEWAPFAAILFLVFLLK